MKGLFSRERWLRDIAGFLYRRPAVLPPDFPATVSFTFDDVPATALRTAAPILEDAGMPGTWYIATGILGQASPVGRVLTLEGLPRLREGGHEIGGHGHDHLRAAEVGGRFANDVAANAAALRALLPGLSLESFSYPYGSISPVAKASAARTYRSARTIHSGIARGRLDLAALPGNALYERMPLDGLLAGIRALAERPGWLILYTHDVTRTPSPWGCTPETFAAVVAAVGRAGLRVRTVGDVVSSLSPRS